MPDRCEKLIHVCLVKIQTAKLPLYAQINSAAIFAFT